jgi:hypothetical protein
LLQIFLLFWFRDFLGYFLKNWALFSKTSGHPDVDLSSEDVYVHVGNKILMEVDYILPIEQNVLDAYAGKQLS